MPRVGRTSPPVISKMPAFMFSSANFPISAILAGLGGGFLGLAAYVIRNFIVLFLGRLGMAPAPALRRTKAAPSILRQSVSSSIDSVPNFFLVSALSVGRRGGGGRTTTGNPEGFNGGRPTRSLRRRAISG